MIPAYVIETLIEIGRAGDPNEPVTAANLSSISQLDHINRLHWKAWDEFTTKMPTADLVDLTKGLTLAECSCRWAGGSVAAAIWTFQQIQKRNPILADQVADWVLPRTRNRWVPYGKQNHGARSAKEYQLAEIQRAEQISEGRTAEKENEELARAEGDVRIVQREQSAKDRNTDVRAKLIDELTILPLKAQLNQLACDERYSVEFYPTRIADATTTELLESLSEDVRIALWKKLKGKRRGPWSKFKRRLRSTFSNIPWNRKGWFQ